jgi:hypothetical protein
MDGYILCGWQHDCTCLCALFALGRTVLLAVPCVHARLGAVTGLHLTGIQILALASLPTGCAAALQVGMAPLEDVFLAVAGKAQQADGGEAQQA